MKNDYSQLYSERQSSVTLWGTLLSINAKRDWFLIWSTGLSLYDPNVKNNVSAQIPTTQLLFEILCSHFKRSFLPCHGGQLKLLLTDRVALKWTNIYWKNGCKAPLMQKCPIIWLVGHGCVLPSVQKTRNFWEEFCYTKSLWNALTVWHTVHHFGGRLIHQTLQHPQTLTKFNNQTHLIC